MTAQGEPVLLPPPRTCPYTPPPLLAELRRDAPISRVRIWDGSTPWLVTRYDDVRAVLVDRRFSVDPSRPGYPARGPASRARRRHGAASFISMDAPQHMYFRRMLVTEFTPRRVQALRPNVERTAAELLDRLVAGAQPADLVDMYALPLPSIVISDLLGVPYGDHAFFEDRARVMMDNTTAADDNRAAGRRPRALSRPVARAALHRAE